MESNKVGISPHRKTARRRPWTRRVEILVAAAVVVAVVAGCSPSPPPTPSPRPTAAPSSGGTVAPPPAAQLVVTVRGHGPAVIGFPYEVRAAALALDGVGGLELWAGGEKVGFAPSAEPDRPAASATWTWVPEAAGETILVARAFDASGRMAQSAPVRVRVDLEPPRSYRLLDVEARAGEDLEAIVAGAGGDLALARHLNPDLGGEPLATGTIVAVPVFEPAGPTSAAPREGGETAFADIELVADGRAIVPPGLAVPGLDVAVEDCNVTATASGAGDTAVGLSFTALPPGADAFLPLPPVAPSAGGGSTSFAVLGGVNYVTVASYDTEASTASAIVPVVVPESCGEAGWAGTARLDGSRLVAPREVERAYLYLDVGDTGWQRVPAAAGSFVGQVDRGFDFGAVLPDLAGRHVRLEAWGWAGGLLTKLGDGEYTPPSAPLYGGVLDLGGAANPVLGVGTTLDVVVVKGGGEITELLARHSAVDRPGPNAKPASKTFKWSTSVAGITHFAWQVLPYPLEPASLSLAPPFLIDSDTIQAQGLSGGYFSLDLKPYLVDKTTSAGVWSTELLGQQIVGQGATATPYLAGAKLAPNDVSVAPNAAWWPPSGEVTLPPDAQAAVGDLAFLGPALTTLNVRIIPFVGSTPVPEASNVVSFDIVEPGEPLYIDTSPPPPPPTYTDAYTNVKSVFFAPTGAKAAYARCVRVVSGGKTVSEPLYTIYGGTNWKNGTVHCMPPPSDDDWDLLNAFESFVGWAGTVWDYVADGYDYVQDAVIDVVLAVVPCAELADEVTSNGEDVCKKLAKAALHAVMIAYGIPPEIPSWEATVAAYKGDLKAWILENAKTLPGVTETCDGADVAHAIDSDAPTCDQVVDEAVERAIDEITLLRSSSAAKSTGVPVPPGIVVEPDPRGMAQPPHFEVTLTRTDAPLPAGASCSLGATMTSAVKGWTWSEYQWTNGQPSTVTKGPATVTGQPFAGVSQAIAPLAPGETATYQLWMAKPNVWFEPDGWNDHYAQQYAEWSGSHNHAWVLLQQGAVVTGLLSSTCTTGGKATETLTGAAYQ